MTSDGRKGPRASGRSSVAGGSNPQSTHEKDDDEDDGGATEQAQEDDDEAVDEASDAAEDQEDIQPIKRTNSRGQVTLKSELEARRQAVGKRPDGRKAKPLGKKKLAPRKKAKDRVRRKTNLEKYVWLPPKPEGEATDDSSEITESDKAEAGAKTGPETGEETALIVQTEEQQVPVQDERPAPKRKTTEVEDGIHNEETLIGAAELPEALDLQHLVKRRKKVHDTGDEETGEGAVSADSTSEAVDIQHLVIKRKKVHDTGEEQTGEGAVPADSTSESAVPSAESRPLADEEIDKLLEFEE